MYHGRKSQKQLKLLLLRNSTTTGVSIDSVLIHWFSDNRLQSSKLDLNQIRKDLSTTGTVGRSRTAFVQLHLHSGSHLTIVGSQSTS